MKAQLVAGILDALRGLTERCRLCENRCEVNRIENVAGRCRTTSADCFHVRYASHSLHFGEEPMLVGRGGSGTVFFTHCNLRCVFCQNFQISQLGMGTDIHYEELSDIFLKLQREGAENINLVTPTHYVYPIMLALQSAYQGGLRLPLVYNTNAYETPELLALLDGLVDIYLPDMKYMDAACGEKYSGATNYPETAKKAIIEMYRQVGPLTMEGCVARKGLIIRHLVLPNHLAGSYDFLLWLMDAGLCEATIGLMSQYGPRHRAREFKELREPVDAREYKRIVEYASDLGFTHILAQGPDSHAHYVPDFSQKRPFPNDKL